jgi:TolB-like protein/Tfp pilus assembly protein PilF
MTDPDESHLLIFGQFQLDLEKRELRRDGAPVKLGSRAVDILCVLAQAEGKVVSKNELMAEIWPGLVVEESNIQVHVSNLRKALNEGSGGQSFVVTVPGRGYRLLGLQSRPQAEQPGIRPTVNVSETCVAVLRFTNMSGDPQQEYFADGIVEDIITGLSRIKWLFVIARNSSFIYRGKPIDVRQVARELGSRYVLEGSVRRFGDRVRLTAQLIEAQSGRSLWAERYDRLLDDIFAVQDEITMSVIGAIEPNLRRAEVDRVMRKRPHSLDAYELVLRALPSVNNFMVTGAVAAIPMLQKALELEPDYAGAHALLARCFHFQYSRGGLHEQDRIASIHHARAAMNSDDATTLAIAGLMIWFDEHDVGTAFDLFDRALAISNSNVVALGNSAFALAWMGETDRAIERARRALRVSPFDTLIAYLAIAIAQFHAKRYDEAREAARRAAESNPSFSVPHILLGVALVPLGRSAEAKAAAQRVLELDPGFTMRSWSVTVGVVPSVFEPFVKAWRKLGFVDA